MAQQYGYEGRSNPYNQRGGAPAAPQGGYGGQAYGGQPYGGRQHYNGQAMGRDDYGGQNVEMEPLTAGMDGPGHPMQDPNAILNECRDIDRGIAVIEESLGRLKVLQLRTLDETDTSAQSATNRELDRMTSDIMNMYRNFAGRIKALKRQPESGSPKNAPQLGKIDRRLKEAIMDYRKVDSEFQHRLKDQMARQYRIVRPDASEAEVREAVEDTSNQQVFSQALLQSDRRGQSRSALSAVQNRHEAIRKIEQQMVELAELFQEMEALVVQQEAAVVGIEQKGEEVVDHMDKGNQEIGTAIKSARNARKWKWWCLGICVLIVIIIVVVILIYKFVIQNNGSGKRKRFVLPSADMPALISARSVSGQAWTPSEKLVVPGLEWTSDNTLESTPVVSDTESAPPTLSGKWTKFAA